MRHRLLAVALLGLTAVPLLAQESTVGSRDAAAHAGETVAVRGVVVAVFISSNRNVFLNFDRPYPDQTFQAVIFHNAAESFGDVRRFEGKEVIVSGRITIYHGKPEIVLDSPSQIRFATGEAAPMAGDSGPAAPVRATRPCVVEIVHDGDTITCTGGERVRFIGIDAPEMDQAPFGARARTALFAVVALGDTVLLEPDVEPRDQYERTLAYLWKDGALLNWVLVRQGWAVQSTHAPNVQYVERLSDAERRARTERRGLWASGGFDCRPADHRHGRCD